MDKNIFSLLSGNWMFADNSESVLFPFVFKLMNASDFKDVELNSTETIFYQSNSVDFSESSSDNLTSESVAVVKFHHPVFKYNQTCGPKGTQSIMEMMDAWKNEKNIKAVVFDYNTPGGQASGCAEFAEYNNNYPKPIVCYTKDVIGSAGYYAAAGSDYIIADKHADFIGSIGSMVKQIDLEGVIRKKGGTINEFYSDLSPEKNFESRELKKGNERPLIQNIINPLAQQFHDDIKKYRPSVSEKALRGGVFSPSDALKEGLVDEIGTFQDAINKAFELSKNNSSNSNNSNLKMSKKINVPAVQSALGYTEPFGANENGVFLQETELQKLNTVLEETTKNAVDLQTDLDTVNKTFSTAETAINTALDNAEIEYNDSTSLEAKINLLNDQRNEYANRPAGTPSGVASTGDANLDKGAQEVVYAHVEEAKKLLNQ